MHTQGADKANYSYMYKSGTFQELVICAFLTTVKKNG